MLQHPAKKNILDIKIKSCVRCTKEQINVADYKGVKYQDLYYDPLPDIRKENQRKKTLYICMDISVSIIYVVYAFLRVFLPRLHVRSKMKIVHPLPTFYRVG